MRKLLTISLVLVLFASVAYAAENPVDQGSMTVGGAVYYANLAGDLYEVDGDALSMFAATPQFGYFVIPNLMIGGMVDFGSASQGDEKASTLGVGPIIGYFFDMTKGEVKGSIYPYILGFFTYHSMSDEAWDEDYTGYSFGGKAGINYMLSDGIALDGGVKFSSVSMKYGDEDSVSGTQIWVGAGISIFVY